MEAAFLGNGIGAGAIRILENKKPVSIGRGALQLIDHVGSSQGTEGEALPRFYESDTLSWSDIAVQTGQVNPSEIVPVTGSAPATGMSKLLLPAGIALASLYFYFKG